MSKNKIKFSHVYPKLWGQTRATLLAVRELDLPQDVNADLLDYDTAYYADKETNPNGPAQGAYGLKNGPHVQLIFVGNKHIPFCTIRTRKGRYGDKKEYYLAKVGQEFEIVIAQKNGAAGYCKGDL